jgi:pimeloyl-ACP methyl ester carboxylesterase
MAEGIAMLAPIKHKNHIAFFEAVPSNSDDDTTYLLLHGIGTSLHFWTAIAPALGITSRTIALDLPGFGDSPSPPAGFRLDRVSDQIRGFMRTLDLTNTVLVAHSLGAFVAFDVAAAEPARVRRLIIVDGTLGRVANLLKKPYLAFRNPSLALHIATYLVESTIPLPVALARVVGHSRLLRTIAFEPYVADPKGVDPRLVSAATPHSGNLVSLQAMLQGHEIDYPALLRAVPQPVDLVVGDQDPLVNEADIQQAIGLVNARRTLRIINCGHWPMIEHPTLLTSFIRAWKTDDKSV